MARKRNEEQVEASTPPVRAEVDAGGMDDLRPVRVANHGDRPWIGSDYRHFDGGIAGKGVGIVTLRKFRELAEHYKDGPGDVGPFELLGEV